MTIDKLLAQHGHILTQVAALEAIADASQPPRPETLARARWHFTRELFAHLDAVEQQFYAPLRSDSRANAARQAAVSTRIRDARLSQFRAHVDRWLAFPEGERWKAYRSALRRLCRLVRSTLDAEARDLGRYWPPFPAADTPRRARRDFLAECWSIRQRIFDGDPAEPAAPFAAGDYLLTPSSRPDRDGGARHHGQPDSRRHAEAASNA